jgi:uncharacterized damage-inducible protein DinB
MGGEVARLEEQIRRAFDGTSWHGPAVSEVLEGLTPESAAAHPMPGAHSIWEIVLHLAAGYRLVLRRARGEHAQITPEEDWPPVPAPSDQAWEDSVRSLSQLNRELRAVVRAFPEKSLDSPLGSEYSAYVQIAGIPQHDLYHAGQVVLLRKALGAVSRLG